MSAMTISKSYAVLLGLEGYAKTRKKLKEVGKFFGKGKGDGEIGGAGGEVQDRRATAKGAEGVGKIGEERVMARR